MEESELKEESKFEEEFIPLDFGGLSDGDWCVIHNNFPELRKRRKPPLDDFIVEFLRRYDVFVTPITSGSRDICLEISWLKCWVPLICGRSETKKGSSA